MAHQCTDIRLDQARADILKETPAANIETVIVDLDSLASVRQGGKAIAALDNVDVLIHNAAVMMNPYSTTSDGIESQFGTNYLGPWLLTNLLLPSLLKTPNPRVVLVSSSGHTLGGIRFDDIGFQDGQVYDKRAAYGQSKTGNILNAVALADKYGKDGLLAISPAGYFSPRTYLCRKLLTAAWSNHDQPRPAHVE
jgi:NAD(P)-dependent dehydrogenase (short-subunit alcohol dehydrogenase family)